MNKNILFFLLIVTTPLAASGSFLDDKIAERRAGFKNTSRPIIDPCAAKSERLAAAALERRLKGNITFSAEAVARKALDTRIVTAVYPEVDALLNDHLAELTTDIDKPQDTLLCAKTIKMSILQFVTSRLAHYPELVKKLLRHGANPTIANDSFPHSPLVLAKIKYWYCITLQPSNENLLDSGLNILSIGYSLAYLQEGYPAKYKVLEQLPEGINSLSNEPLTREQLAALEPLNNSWNQPYFNLLKLFSGIKDDDTEDDETDDLAAAFDSAL